MGKAPAFQFYVRDWLSDPALRMASTTSRGIWIDLLCYMWESPTRGTLVISRQGIVRMTGASTEEVQAFLQECDRLKFADVTICNNDVTLSNRRMVRDQKDRENGRLRTRKHRSNAACNTDVTPPSSSSSSSSPSKKNNNLAQKQIALGDQDICISYKKRKVTGWKLEGFRGFWESFEYKKDRAKALDSWVELFSEKEPSEQSRKLYSAIVAGAKIAAKNREDIKKKGRTPQHAQGWLTARRWEDEDTKPSTKTESEDIISKGM